MKVSTRNKTPHAQWRLVGESEEHDFKVRSQASAGASVNICINTKDATLNVEMTQVEALSLALSLMKTLGIR